MSTFDEILTWATQTLPTSVVVAQMIALAVLAGIGFIGGWVLRGLQEQSHAWRYRYNGFDEDEIDHIAWARKVKEVQ